MTYTTSFTNSSARELTLDELDDVSAGLTVKPAEVLKSAAAFAGIGALAGTAFGAGGIAVGTSVGAVVGAVIELIQENV